MSVYLKLSKIQTTLKANKNQYNSFGKYSYRSCEDILEALKPLLKENKSAVILKDEITELNGRFYIKATATFIDAESGEKVETTALAREEETKKGMDLSQVSGSTSSYARKYALNGLFAIDDNKDSDFTNTHGKENNTFGNTSQGSTKGNNFNQRSNQQNNKNLTEAQLNRLYAISNKANIAKEKLESMIKQKYNKKPEELTRDEYDHICNSLEKK